MRWDDFRRSDNIEDDRDAGYGGGYGGGFGLPGGGLGIGTVIVLGLIGWATGIDPRILIGGAELIDGGSQYQQDYRPSSRRTGAAMASKALKRGLRLSCGSWKTIWIWRRSGEAWKSRAGTAPMSVPSKTSEPPS